MNALAKERAEKAELNAIMETDKLTVMLKVQRFNRKMMEISLAKEREVVEASRTRSLRRKGRRYARAVRKGARWLLHLHWRRAPAFSFENVMLVCVLAFCGLALASPASAVGATLARSISGHEPGHGANVVASFSAPVMVGSATDTKSNCGRCPKQPCWSSLAWRSAWKDDQTVALEKT